jgi:phage gp36-like protein
MGDYIAQVDLEDAISPHTVVELFDDNEDGGADTTPLDAVIARAEAQVNSYLARAYKGLTLPVTQSPASDMLKQAALMFAIPYAFQRHPEYVRKFGENPRDKSMLQEAHAFMKSLCEGDQNLFDVPAQTTPSIIGSDVTDNDAELTFMDTDGSRFIGDF